MTEEIWKDIAGYEGLYKVSNLGNVKNLRYRNKHEEHLLTKRHQKNGYLTVSLSKNSIYKNFLIHRLVADVFIENPYNFPCVNHKDENKRNNCVDNLEWCTYKYNNNYGTHREKEARTKEKKVFQYTKDGKFVKEFYSTQEAKRCTGINQGNIWACCTGRYKSAGGYIWKFKNND